MKGQKGIRILAPIVGIKRKKDEEANKDVTKQNTRVLVGFRNAYVFDVEQTEGAELPTLREMTGTVGENRERLVSFIEAQGIELAFTEKIAPALGDELRREDRHSSRTVRGRGIQHPCSRTRTRDVA